MANKKPTQTSSISYDTQTIITVLTLILVYPIGVILMYKWMNWGKGLKFILSLPVYIFLLIVVIAFLSALSPKESYERGQCVATCKASGTQGMCVQECLSNLKKTSDMPQNK
jgi:hypothetical protein